MGKMLQTGCSSYLGGPVSNGRIACSASWMPVNDKGWVHITLWKDPHSKQTWQGAWKGGGDRGEEIRRMKGKGWEGGGAGMAKVG